MAGVHSSQWRRLAAIAASLCGCCALLLFWADSPSSSSGSETTAASTARRNLGRSPADCEKTCQVPPLKDLQHFDGDDLLSPKKLLERLRIHREMWVKDRLKKDYGDANYQNMFTPMEEVMDSNNQTKKERVSAGRNRVFRDVTLLPKTKRPDLEDIPAEGDGWNRFVRKMEIKLLQVQLGILEERQNAKAICLDECATSEEEGSRFLKVNPSTGVYSKFTWATGGHSASAGHGNFFHESYTANMDRALTPILRSIGIDFEARNYAMGGTDSAEEVALCMNQIFGRDIDFISWDYGMTDGHELWKILLYAYKAARISQIGVGHSMPGNIAHRPAMIGIHQGLSCYAVQSLFDLGMTALVMNEAYLHSVVLDAVPDMSGLNDKQIAGQPPFVQYLKCDGRIEVGDPGCGDKKFNATTCLQRKARTSWHPGWKYHALVGNLLAMTILDGLEDAIQNLIEEFDQAQVDPKEDPQDTHKRVIKRLQALDAQEKNAYDNIFKAPMPTDLKPIIDRWWPGEQADHMTDVDIEAFYKEPSLCHTAILPAQARFHGFITENFTAVGEILDQNYEQGVSSTLLSSVETPGRRSTAVAAAYVTPEGDQDKMLLVKDDGGRQVCEEYLNLDFKDYFFVSNLEGWRTLTVPNNSEKKEYSEFDAKKGKGYILACLARCDWGKCPEGDLHSRFGWNIPQPPKDQAPPTAEELAKFGKVEITINGESVTEASDMHTCYALKNRKGHVWQPNADGRYEIKVRVNGGTAYSYIRVSAFVLV